MTNELIAKIVRNRMQDQTLTVEQCLEINRRETALRDRTHRAKRKPHGP